MQRPDPQQGRYFQPQQNYQRQFPPNQPPYFNEQPSAPQPPLSEKMQHPWLHDSSACAECPYRKDGKKHRRRRKFRLTNTVFSLIGMGTVCVLLVKYLIIPLLVYLYGLSGGAL